MFQDWETCGSNQEVAECRPPRQQGSQPGLEAPQGREGVALPTSGLRTQRTLCRPPQACLFPSRIPREQILYPSSPLSCPRAFSGYQELTHNFLTLLAFFFFLYLLFRATFEAYGGSQARGLIKGTAAGLHHSHRHARYHRSWQCRILNLLSKARDRTHNLMVPSQIRFHCATMGTP